MNELLEVVSTGEVTGEKFTLFVFFPDGSGSFKAYDKKWEALRAFDTAQKNGALSIELQHEWEVNHGECFVTETMKEYERGHYER